MHTCCENLGLTDEATRKEYRFLKGLLYRIGATAVIKRLETKYAAALAASATADKALDYLRKRKQNMGYGQLRKNGFFKHRTNRETSILSARTGLLVQALKALGQEHVNASVMATLRKQFDAKERARAVREARYATAWVYEVIKRLAREEGAPRDA